ncbi:MAG: hypothetical protein V8S42_01485 [Lachnospiraceae bacterium]
MENIKDCKTKFLNVAMALYNLGGCNYYIFLMNLVPGGPFMSEKAISPQATGSVGSKIWTG